MISQNNNSQHKEYFVFIIAWFLFFCFFNPGFPSFETPAYELILNVIQGHGIAAKTQLSPLFLAAPNGLYYEVHDIGANILALPAAWVSNKILQIFGVTAQIKHIAFVCGFLGCLYMSIMLWFFYVTLVRCYHNNKKEAFLSACFLATGTQILVYSSAGSDITLSSMLIAMLFYCLKTYWQTKRLSILLWAFVVSDALIITRISTLPAAFLILVFLFFEHELCFTGKLKKALLGMLVISPVLVWIFYYNDLRTGSPFISPLTNNPIAMFDMTYYKKSLLGTIFSPSKGLLIFNPLLLLFPIAAYTWRNNLKKELVFIITFFTITLLRTGAMQQWTSGGGWGMRYYTYMIALFFIPLSLWHNQCLQRKNKPVKMVFILLWCFGFLINLSGLLANWHYRQSLLGEKAWDFPWSIDGQAMDAIYGFANNILRTLGGNVPLQILPHASQENVITSNYLNIWWLNIRHIGVPVWLCIFIGLMQLILILLIFRKYIKMITPLSSINIYKET